MKNMKSWALLAVVGASACAEPAVEMSLRLPAENADFDTSCITAVDMYVYGGTYDVNRQDYIYDCKQIKAGATYSDVRTAIHNQFDTRIPDTGLYGVELEAHTGICDPQNSPEDTSHLMFNTSARYFGGNTFPLTIRPVANCALTSMNVRAVDMIALNKTKDCAQATVTDDGTASLLFGELAPSLVDGTFYWSSSEPGTWAASVGTNMGHATVGKEACLAANIGTNTIWSISCVQQTGPTVCATGTEKEIGVVPMMPAIMALDPNKRTKWGGVVMGSVWTTVGATKAPVSGATVTFDTAHGEIDYVEPDAAGTLRTTANATATGASGMFVVFTDTVLPITIKSGAKTRTIMVGSDKKYPAGALVMLP
jgi:hypothetical protein